MSLRNFDNFGNGGPVEQDYGYVLEAVLSAGTGIGGTYSLRTTTAKTGEFNNGVYEGFASQDRTGIKGVWSNFTVAGSDSALIEVWQGDVAVAVKPTGTSLQVWTVNGGTLHTEASAITASTFKLIELKWRMSSLDAGNALNFDGFVELRINRVAVFTADDIQLGFALPVGDTRDVQWNVVVFNPHGDGDKHYLCDGAGDTNNDYLPANVNIYTVLPSTGNGSFAELTPLTGTDQGAMVDESASDGDTTYLSMSGSAQKSTFNFADFSSISTQLVYGLKHVAYGKKVEGGYRRFRPLAVRDSLPYFSSTDYPVGIGYFAWQSHVWETDPFTGKKWTIDNINDTEFGTLVG